MNHLSEDSSVGRSENPGVGGSQPTISLSLVFGTRSGGIGNQTMLFRRSMK
jgi:hypothetical protein